MDEKDYAARLRNLKASRFLYRADVIARVESIICVDSDFDKFLHPGLLEPTKHILQTHVYSWENHHCQKDNLQQQWNLLNTGTFDFEIEY